ncbi:hypothetical protein [Streptosporangium sp. NPDC002607]
MAMLKAGDRLRSRVCTTEVIVVRATGDDVSVCCGGLPMARGDEVVEKPSAGSAPGAPGTLLGKRYSDEARRVELLCVQAGDGPLTIDGQVLSTQTAKPLPASD